jgi:hypothetical protein
VRHDWTGRNETDRPVFRRGGTARAENAPRKTDVAARAIEQRISFPFGARPFPRQFVEKICLCGVAPLLGVRIVVNITTHSAAVKRREEFRKSSPEGPQVASGRIVPARTKQKFWGAIRSESDRSRQEPNIRHTH